MENSDSPKDKLGQDIVAGAYIVYAIQIGQSPHLRFGKVLKVERKHHEYIVRDDWRISVQGVSDWSWSDRDPTLIKKSTIGFPDRVAVVPESVVPEKYLHLLRDVT